MKGEDVFDDVHDLMRRCQYETVCEVLLDQDRTMIRPPYDDDVNHAWYIVGDAYYRRGEYVSAISAFRKAVESWPEDGQAILALANSYSECGLPGSAESVLRNALKKWPENDRYAYNLGNALFDQGKYEDAILVYEAIGGESKLAPLAKKNISAARHHLAG